jgi:hypothetical protein
MQGPRRSWGDESEDCVTLVHRDHKSNKQQYRPHRRRDDKKGSYRNRRTNREENRRDSYSHINNKNYSAGFTWINVEVFANNKPSHVEGYLLDSLAYVPKSQRFCETCAQIGHTSMECATWKTSPCTQPDCQRHDFCTGYHPGRSDRREAPSPKCIKVKYGHGKKGSMIAVIMGCKSKEHQINDCPYNALIPSKQSNQSEDETESRPSSPTYVPSKLSPEYSPTSPVVGEDFGSGFAPTSPTYDD